MRLSELQQEQAEWAERNFGPANTRPPHWPLLGALEELGELSHSHLKNEQGIRGTVEEHTAGKLDAVGDIVIYLADYCTLNGLDLESTVSTVWWTVKKRDWVASPVNGETSRL